MNRSTHHPFPENPQIILEKNRALLREATTLRQVLQETIRENRRLRHQRV